MKAVPASLVVFALLVSAGELPAQFVRPPPLIRPPPFVPRPMPFPPRMPPPHTTPFMPPPGQSTTHPVQPTLTHPVFASTASVRLSDYADAQAIRTLVASTVALVASPQGPLEAASLLGPHEFSYARRDNPALVRAVLGRVTSVVGLTCSPQRTLEAALALVSHEHRDKPAGLGEGPILPGPAPSAQQGGQSGDAAPGNFLQWAVPVVIGVVVLGAIGMAVRRSAQSATSTRRVRIVAIPPGEAPSHVRAAWVGLELPVDGPSDSGGRPVYGVLSNRPAGCDGYAVDGRQAVALLAATAPEAAAWWRTHAPHVSARGYQLVFPAEVCDPVV